MPLLKGKKNIGRNIRELEKPSKNAPGGRPYQQALAISLKAAGVSKSEATDKPAPQPSKPAPADAHKSIDNRAAAAQLSKLKSKKRMHEMYNLLRECGEDVSCGCGCGDPPKKGKGRDGKPKPELDEKPKPQTETAHRDIAASSEKKPRAMALNHLAATRKGGRSWRAAHMPSGYKNRILKPAFVKRKERDKAAYADADHANKAAERSSKSAVTDDDKWKASVKHDKAASNHQHLAMLHREAGSEDAAQEADVVAKHHSDEAERLRRSVKHWPGTKREDRSELRVNRGQLARSGK